MHEASRIVRIGLVVALRRAGLAIVHDHGDVALRQIELAEEVAGRRPRRTASATHR